MKDGFARKKKGFAPPDTETKEEEKLLERIQGALGIDLFRRGVGAVRGQNAVGDTLRCQEFYFGLFVRNFAGGLRNYDQGLRSIGGVERALKCL